MPKVEQGVDIEINSDDLRVDVFRAGGHGGQNVQKNSTAVRITHIPSGTVVACQNERSQHQNREIAMRILTARLLEIERRKKEAELAELKGAHISAEWGNQIRSYVLHPYQMVKDHRTGLETSDTSDVLDGNLDGFITAFLTEQLGSENYFKGTTWHTFSLFLKDPFPIKGHKYEHISLGQMHGFPNSNPSFKWLDTPFGVEGSKPGSITEITNLGLILSQTFSKSLNEQTIIIKKGWYKLPL